MLNEKIKIVMVSAGVSGRQLAAAFGISPQSATTKISRGVKNIDDLLRLCSACGASLTITTKNGITIPLTLEDVEPKKKE